MNNKDITILEALITELEVSKYREAYYEYKCDNEEYVNDERNQQQEIWTEIYKITHELRKLVK